VIYLQEADSSKSASLAVDQQQQWGRFINKKRGKKTKIGAKDKKTVKTKLL
jgi:hypothetical protein